MCQCYHQVCHAATTAFRAQLQDILLTAQMLSWPCPLHVYRVILVTNFGHPHRLSTHCRVPSHIVFLVTREPVYKEAWFCAGDHRFWQQPYCYLWWYDLACVDDPWYHLTICWTTWVILDWGLWSTNGAGVGYLVISCLSSSPADRWSNLNSVAALLHTVPLPDPGPPRTNITVGFSWCLAASVRSRVNSIAYSYKPCLFAYWSHLRC